MSCGDMKKLYFLFAVYVRMLLIKMSACLGIELSFILQIRTIYICCVVSLSGACFSLKGTYNNQYMVVDLNRVTLGRRIDEGALTVIEQIPGLVVSSDQTQALRQGMSRFLFFTFVHELITLYIVHYYSIVNYQCMFFLYIYFWNSHVLVPLLKQFFHKKGYWASYNVPFHQDIYNLSGYELMLNQLGEDYSYDLCPRAKIFRRDQGRVLSWASMKHIMRYNSEC